MITTSTISRRKKLFVALMLVVTVFVVQAGLGAKSHAAYDPGRLIDSGIFLDANAMSKEQIQSFLQARGGGLANMHFALQCYGADSQERQWYVAAGAPCDTSIPASHIIFYASQIYGVNPRVILATIQKEQSLVTAVNPTSWQLNQAMGYACPTSGACGGNSTFPYQIDSGTWVLRYHFERARGNMDWWKSSSSWVCGTEKNYYKPNLYPNQNVRFYDQDNVHYTTIYLQNAASSSFYCYTPHAYNNPQGLYGRAAYGTTGRYYSGSYNFVHFYELWFGSTQHSFLVRTPESPTYYLLSNNRRFAIPSGDILYAYGLERMRVDVVSRSYLDGITDGGVLGTLFTVAGDGTVYLADGGKKHGIASGQYCVDWGLGCGDPVAQKQLGLEVVSLLRQGGVLQPVMKFQNSYYLMTGGKKHQFLGDSALAQRGYSTSGSTAVINWTNSIRQFGNSLPENNSFVKYAANSGIYVYSGGNYYTIPDYATFTAWVGSGRTHLDATSSYNHQLPVASGSINAFVVENGSQSLITSTSRLSLPGSAAASGRLDLNVHQSLKPLLAQKKNSSAENKALATPAGTILALQNGVLRPIPTMTDLKLSFSSSDTLTAPTRITTIYPVGKLHVVSGRTFKPTGSASVYVYGEDKYLWALGSVAELNSVFGWSKDTIMTRFENIDYVGVRVYTGLVRVGGSLFATQGDGSLRPLPAEAIESPETTALPITPPVSLRLKIGSAASFIRFDNGTIFKIEAGVIRPLSSLNSYHNNGGTAANTMHMPLKSLPAFKQGAVL